MTFQYPSLAAQAIFELAESESGAIQRAVDIIASKMIGGGVLQVFGTGHTRLPIHEMTGRAGGLRPINLIRMQDLAMHGGEASSRILDPLLERDPSFAQPL